MKSFTERLEIDENRLPTTRNALKSTWKFGESQGCKAATAPLGQAEASM
jgi:hypothetical protein